MFNHRSPLFEALLTSDLASFEAFLKNPNEKYQGIPILHAVVRRSGPYYLDRVLKTGADVNLLTDKTEKIEPSTALQWITGMMHEDYFFGDPDNYNKSTPITYSVAIGTFGPKKLIDRFSGTSNDIMKAISVRLLNNGAILDFYSACALGNDIFVNAYLKKFPHILLQPGPDGSAALAWAARRGQNKIVSLLLQLGANVDQPNTYTGLSPLEESLKKFGDAPTFHLLIKHGALIKQGIFSCCLNNPTHMKNLLQYIKKPNQFITDEEINIMLKSIMMSSDFLKIMRDHHISVASFEQSKKFLPLIYDYLFIQDIKRLKMLISLGCDINAIYSNDQCRIHNLDTSFVGLKPLEFLYKYCCTYSGAKITCLMMMAILFLNGSSPISNDDHKTNFLDQLSPDDLIYFLECLYIEINENPKLEFKVDISLRPVLMPKIDEGISRIDNIEESQEIKKHLKKIQQLFQKLFQVPSLKTLGIKFILNNDLFQQSTNLPKELKEELLENKIKMRKLNY